MKNRWVKYTAAALTALAVVVLAAALWLRFFFPAERFRQIAEKRLSASLGRNCTIAGLKVSIWRGFALDLADVAVEARQDEQAPYLLNARHIYLGVKLLPLLKKRLEVVGFTVSGAEVWVVRHEDGRLNLASLFEEKKPAGPQPEEKPGEGFSLVLHRARLEDCLLHYADRKTGLRLSAGPAGAGFRIDPAVSGPLPLEGEVTLGGIRDSSSEYLLRLGRLFPLTLKFAGRVEGRWENVVLGRVQVGAAGVALTGDAGLSGIGGQDFSYRLNLSGGAGRLDDLTPLFAADGKAAVDRAGGSVKIDLQVSGPAGETGDAAYRIEVRGENLSLDLTGGAGRLEAKLARVEIDNNGTAVSLESALWDSPGRPLPLEVPRAELFLAGDDLNRGSLELAAGKSTLKADLRVKNYPALFADEKTAKPAYWDLQVTSPRLALEDFFGPGFTSPGESGAAPAPSPDTTRLRLHPGRGLGTLSAERLIVSSAISLDRVNLGFTVIDSLFTLDKISAGLYSGTLEGRGGFTLSGPGLSAYQFDLDGTGFHAAELVSPFSSIGRYLSGSVATRIHLVNKATAGEPLKNLEGTAAFTLADGRLQGWPVLDKLASFTGITELDSLRIERWVGMFDIRDQKVTGRDLGLETDVGTLRAGGAVGFDGSLDYSLALLLNENLTRKYRKKLPGEIASLFTGSENRLELNFLLGGTTSDPSLKWDTGPLKKRLQAKIGSQFDKLIDRLLPDGDSRPDSASADSTAADTSQAKPKPQDQLKGLLRGLLKKKPGPNRE
ncbi:MAG: AsmA-like C-terminal region-containing protein [Candidatus Glassbacteria bacterium]